jgi:DNA-binding transcriptional LysR family regulator
MDCMRAMTTFVKVAEAGGFAAAARLLGLSPSAVTLQVQQLEQHLGGRLINRTTRNIHLTEVGRAYYERCLGILAAVDEAEQMVRTLHSTPSGTLRLNVSRTMPPLISPALEQFARLYPATGVEAIATDDAVNLVEAGFDMSVRTPPFPETNLIVRRLASYRLIICGAPAYLTAQGAPQHPTELAAHNCLIHTSSPWHDEWPYADGDGEGRVRVTGNLRSNSFVAIRLAALGGQGLMAVQSFQAAEDIRAGRLVPVLSEYLTGDFAVLATYPHRNGLSAKVRVFLDLLARHFRENAGLPESCGGQRAA